jgi:transposase
VKNTVQSLLHRKLLHCPHPSIFTRHGRWWLERQSYTDGERLVLDGSLKLLDELETRITEFDEKIRVMSSGDESVKLLMTIPGVDLAVASGMAAAIGDVKRFSSPDKLACYFGLVPRVRQSAAHCYHGRIAKTGRSHARFVAVEAAQVVAMSQVPLTATYYRVRRKRGHNVAVTLARKLVAVTALAPQTRGARLAHAHKERALQIRSTGENQKEAPAPYRRHTCQARP